MKELLRTNDPTIIAFATALLDGEGIDWFELDVNMSIPDGSIGILPRRLMVLDRDLIAAERAMLAPVRAGADLIIDTSALSVPSLRAGIENAFGGETVAQTAVTVESFGFKYGLPMDADMVMDVRFLPNPHWVDELRPQTGQSPAVRDYVLTQPGATEFLQTYHQLLKLVADGYLREGKRYMTVAIGCTGGKHRSVAIAEALAGLLTENRQLTVRVLHRDLGRE
jgi:UPF0042 nucleotide-binding protein